MTILPLDEIRNIWLDNGGSSAGANIATGVALAESGGDTRAISPASDYGVWQINAIHFGTVGINSGNWSDPNVNARAAIALSANGSNWAAWCTCWLNPGQDCGHGFLQQPQTGTPAYNEWQVVVRTLGAGPIVRAQPSGPTGGIAAVHDAWGELQNLFTSYGPTRYNQLLNAANGIVRL